MSTRIIANIIGGEDMMLLRGDSFHGIETPAVDWSKIKQVIFEASLYESSVNEEVQKQTCIIAIENADGLFVVKPFRDNKPGLRSTWCFLSLVVILETSSAELPADALLARVMSADIGEFISSEESKFGDFVEELKSISFESKAATLLNQLSLSSESLADKGRVRFVPYTLRSKILATFHASVSGSRRVQRKANLRKGKWSFFLNDLFLKLLKEATKKYDLGNTRPLGRL